MARVWPKKGHEQKILSPKSFLVILLFSFYIYFFSFISLSSFFLSFFSYPSLFLYVFLLLLLFRNEEAKEGREKKETNKERRRRKNRRNNKKKRRRPPQRRQQKIRKIYVDHNFKSSNLMFKTYSRRKIAKPFFCRFGGYVDHRFKP